MLKDRRNPRQSNVKVEKWNFSGTVSINMYGILRMIWFRKSAEKQKSYGLYRKWWAKDKNEESGIISKTNHKERNCRIQEMNWKKSTWKTKREHFESIFAEIMDFQGTGLHDITHTKKINQVGKKMVEIKPLA